MFSTNQYFFLQLPINIIMIIIIALLTNKATFIIFLIYFHKNLFVFLYFIIHPNPKQILCFMVQISCYINHLISKNLKINFFSFSAKRNNSK